MASAVLNVKVPAASGEPIAVACGDAWISTVEAGVACGDPSGRDVTSGDAGVASGVTAGNSGDGVESSASGDAVTVPASGVPSLEAVGAGTTTGEPPPPPASVPISRPTTKLLTNAKAMSALRVATTLPDIR